MGLFDLFKIKVSDGMMTSQKTGIVRNSPDSFVDSGSISQDEKKYYKPDNYYTYYSYPGTNMAVKVITFDERKRLSYPSARGLYVAEIMLLEYCNQGKYPKPEGGYPGFWWFKYGIRDVGHALESLKDRGFVQWAPKVGSLSGLKVEELKQILTKAGLSTTGKKAELIDRIQKEIPDERIIIPEYIPKYELTDLGKVELYENGYVPYMHKHSHLTTEDGRFGQTFTVWDINKLFPNGDAKNWRKVVGEIEKTRFGVDMANAVQDSKTKSTHNKTDVLQQRDEIKKYIELKKDEIARSIKLPGNGFDEESQGMDLKAIGKDKEALVKFYVAIGKKFDAPALYRETAILLHKYGLYEEELSVINLGLVNVPQSNRHREELFERKKKAQEQIKKKTDT
ncbi:SAP domain-containing protein [Butyrivibrio fibrisolvens]|uniref:SAP domain-containing protein n=1 Tax=Butyrivibrio fibrisolvens TaxID=831 RepID=UPI0003B4D17F|nr:SAP domain-containing protein [Butyrivibrio fibrisolvens]